MKKLLKVVGILALTVLGVMGLFALYAAVVEIKVPVNLLGDGRVKVGSWDTGYVSATGTWVSDQERHMSPLNVSEIACFRSSQVCYDAQASIFDGNLTSYLEEYEIQRWDGSTIEFGKDFPCVTYSYAINRATQKLSGSRLKKTETGTECSIIQQEDLKLSFTNGLYVVESLRRERVPTGLFLIVGSGFVFGMLAWMGRVIRGRPTQKRPLIQRRGPGGHPPPMA